MLPGGAGDIGLTPSGKITHGHNMVVRTRALWNAKGYAVLIVDTVAHANLRGLRSAPAYAKYIAQWVAEAHRLQKGPVFLMGTSQGSIAAVNGAAHAPEGSVAGVVLTESVSVLGHSGETVFSAQPERIKIPVLIVANQQDRCFVAPPQMAERIAAAMVASPDVRVATVSGGTSSAASANACGSLTPHGYYGIEQQVVDIISPWLDAHAGRSPSPRAPFPNN